MDYIDISHICEGAHKKKSGIQYKQTIACNGHFSQSAGITLWYDLRLCYSGDICTIEELPYVPTTSIQSLNNIMQTIARQSPWFTENLHSQS